jgi:hypothetical protein
VEAQARVLEAEAAPYPEPAIPPAPANGKPSSASQWVGTTPVVPGPLSRTAGGWVETALIAPGQILTLDLIIDPVNPYRKQEYAFTIKSRAVEPEEATLVSEEGLVQIAGISWFRRYLPIFVVTLLLLILFLGVAYLAWWRLTGFDYFGWLIAY